MQPAPSLVTRKSMCLSAGRYLAFTVAALPGTSTRFPVRLYRGITFQRVRTAPVLIRQHITDRRLRQTSPCAPGRPSFSIPAILCCLCHPAHAKIFNQLYQVRICPKLQEYRDPGRGRRLSGCDSGDRADGRSAGWKNTAHPPVGKQAAFSRRIKSPPTEGLLKKNRICAGKSLNIHGKAVWHGILELTASFAFGNTTIWFPDENVPGN